MPQRLNARIGEAQAGGAWPAPRPVVDLPKRVFADHAVVAESLDVQKTSVGLEADLPQGGKIVQPFADAEVEVLLMVVSVRRARLPCDIA